MNEIKKRIYITEITNTKIENVKDTLPSEIFSFFMQVNEISLKAQRQI